MGDAIGDAARVGLVDCEGAGGGLMQDAMTRTAIDAQTNRAAIVDFCQRRASSWGRVVPSTYRVRSYRWVHSSSSSTDHEFTTRSMVTPVSTALSAPYGCHSS